MARTCLQITLEMLTETRKELVTCYEMCYVCKGSNIKERMFHLYRLCATNIKK
jgi:hypothetical protein